MWVCGGGERVDGCVGVGEPFTHLEVCVHSRCTSGVKSKCLHSEAAHSPQTHCGQESGQQ